ncbi:MAG TPA: hypothetical protein PLX23_06480 [Candidatus Hydrogenedens sp.]|nr:hypothetical protein [Candidatus Hydrogenedens sp.]
MITFLLISVSLFSQIQEINTNSQPLSHFNFRDFNTCFQTSAGFDPLIDIASDVAIVYGTSPDLDKRVQSWREQGYRTAYMTGISWGNYGNYYMSENGLKKEEIQTDKTGKLWMHGNSTTVGYNVPTESYTEYIKQILIPPLENRVESIYLEEPEFWAMTGWSEGFKKLWEKHYGEPWSPPDQSIETQYKASLLKQLLYTHTLTEVFKFVKEYAHKNNFDVGCYVPTHSLINYAQWRIVSPESMLTKMGNCDGVIAQVWTGTARSQHCFRGITKERTFETAYLEYAQMAGMVLPAQKHLIFLADPIEDDPNHDWSDYKYNYESTVLASLLFPEVSTFEVMPWPDRIFKGKYSKSKEEKETKVNIIPEYGTELLTVINSLNDMRQSDIEWISNNYPIGIVVSDTLMFQRAEPNASAPQLNCFFGIATPLVKNGVPIKLIQLEHLTYLQPLQDIKILLLTYEGQKPLNKEYHKYISEWVRSGGCLLIIDDGSDPYNNLNKWWKKEGFNSPLSHLVKNLFNDKEPTEDITQIENGYVWWIKRSPTAISYDKEGDKQLLNWVKEIAQNSGLDLDYKNYFHLRRGPYHICSVQDEAITDTPYTLKGKFINLFNPELKVENEIVLTPSNRALLYDLDWINTQVQTSDIIISAGRIRDKKISDKFLSFTARGPQGIPGKVIILCKSNPVKVECKEQINFSYHCDNDYNLTYLEFIHEGKYLHFEICFQ